MDIGNKTGENPPKIKPWDQLAPRFESSTAVTIQVTFQYFIQCKLSTRDKFDSSGWMSESFLPWLPQK